MNCQKAQSLVTEFIDNTLSARETWELDKHLAECHACTRLVNETRRTVSVLAEAPRYEVSPDFMASLQSRIAGLQQEPARRSWVDITREIFRPRARPIWGAALGACALTAIILTQNANHVIPAGPRQASPAGIVQSARTQSIALVASDPFGDTAAASVAANTTSAPPAVDTPLTDGVN